MNLIFFINRLQSLGILALALLVTCWFNVPSLWAATTDSTNLTQEISPSALHIDFVDSSYTPVVTPNVTMAAATFSFSASTGTGVLGTDSQRLYWVNPDAADSGYVITIAATGGATACWDLSSGGSCGAGDYDYNDAGGATDGDGGDEDADSLGGQLTIDPSAGQIISRTGGTTGMSLGSEDTFSETAPIVSSITLVSADNTSPDISSTYLIDVDLSQAIPAEQPAGSYTINMTVTIT